MWLAGKDSNLDKQLQKLRCYHYTTRQHIIVLNLVRSPRISERYVL